MTVTATLTIDRSSLTLADLTLDGSDTATYGLVSLREPARVVNTTYAPPSADMHGAVPLASTLEQANIAALVRLEATTAAGLRAMRDELYAALGQFTYTATLTVNGQADVYAADMGSVSPRGDLAYEDMARNVAHYQIVIPVYPIGA